MSKAEIQKLEAILADLKTELALRYQQEDERWERIEAHMNVVQPFIEGVQGAKALGKLILWLAGVVGAIGVLYMALKGMRW